MSSQSQPKAEGRGNGGGGGRGGGGLRGGGRSRGGGRGTEATAPKKKTESVPRNTNPPNKGSSSTGGGKPQQPQPPKKSVEVTPEELARREQVRIEEQAAAEKKKQQHKLAAREKERQDRTAAVKEALQLLKCLNEAAAQHAESREQFGVAENLKAARADFEKRKKTIKADLKKCTAFVKKVKSGALYSQKPADVVADVASLNLSRYVEEVVSAMLESKPKVTELTVVTALCQAMHARYADFFPNLLPALWNVVLPSSPSGNNNNSSSSSAVKAKTIEAAVEVSKQRRLYVRLLTDFMVHGLLSSTDTNKLCKLVAEWTGAAVNYSVQDAVATVAFCRAAGFEVFGITSTSTLTAMELIRSEYAKLEQAEKDSLAAAVLDTEQTDGEQGADASALIAEESASIVVSRQLLEEALQVIEQIQPVLKEQRAVSSAATEILSQHCLGAYQTLSSSLVQTHHKLQKLERRCEQDRLLSGQLTANREKGLGDAHKLCESLQKSVEALSDCLNQPVPHLVEEQDDDNAALSGTGVEVWTKDAGGQGQERSLRRCWEFRRTKSNDARKSTPRSTGLVVSRRKWRKGTPNRTT
jgi:hypothetical protein